MPSILRRFIEHGAFFPHLGLDLSAEGEGGQGAGSGGAGQGGTGGTGAGTGSALTPEQVNQINGIFTQRLGRFQAGLDERFAKQDTALEQIRLAVTGGQQPPGGQSQQGQGGGQQQPDPKLAAMEREVAALKERERKRETELAEERRQVAERELSASLKEQLTQLDVNPALLAGALAVVRGRVVQKDGGGWSWKDDSQGYEEQLDLAAGMKKWAASAEGMSYLKPRQDRGAGLRGGTAPGGNLPPPKDPKEAKLRQQQQDERTIAEAFMQMAGVPPADDAA